MWGDLNKNSFKIKQSKKLKILNLALFYSKRASSPAKNEVYRQKTENRPTYWDFGFHGVRSPTSPKFKTHKTFVLQ